MHYVTGLRRVFVSHTERPTRGDSSPLPLNSMAILRYLETFSCISNVPVRSLLDQAPHYSFFIFGVYVANCTDHKLTRATQFQSFRTVYVASGVLKINFLKKW